MPSPRKTPIVVSRPVPLTGQLVTDIVDRIETVAPIDTSGDRENPIQVIVGANGGMGTKISLHAKRYTVQVCVDGVRKKMVLYGVPEQ